MRIPADIRTTINHLIEPLLREREMLNHLEWRIQDILQDWDNVQQTENQNDDDLIADRENGNLRGNMTQWIIDDLLQSPLLFAYFVYIFCPF